MAQLPNPESQAVQSSRREHQARCSGGGRLPLPDKMEDLMQPQHYHLVQLVEPLLLLELEGLKLLQSCLHLALHRPRLLVHAVMLFALHVQHLLLFGQGLLKVETFLPEVHDAVKEGLVATGRTHGVV